MAMAGRSFLTTINLNQLELLNPRAQNLASAPGLPVPGQWYYDTANAAAYFWNGSAWVPTDPSKVSAAFIPFSKLGTPTADFAMGSHKITGLSTPTTAGDAAEFSWVNSRPLSTFATPTANIPMGGFTFTGLNTAPNAAGQAAEYSWVIGQIQSAAAGIASKPPVRIVLTGNDTLSGLAARDGVTPIAGDRVLVTGQTTASANGVYNAASGAWTRTTVDGAAPGEIEPGALWLVTEGTTGAATQWRVATTGTITVGTTSLSIVQFGASSVYTASNGILLTGGNFTAVADPVSLGGITVSSTGIKVDATVVARKFSQTLSGSSTSYTVTHNLGTQDVQVSVRLAASTFDLVECDMQAATTNTVTLGFAVAPVSNTYRVTVIG